MIARYFTLLLVVFVPLVPAVAEKPDEQSAVTSLRTWLGDNDLSDETLAELQSRPFSREALTRQDAENCADLLWQSRVRILRRERKAEFDSRLIQLGDLKMPFWFRKFGQEPESGHSLFISLHGGGGAPAAVNDGQYENQKRLYQPQEGIYLVPRAPTDTWDLWHQKHIDDFLQRLIVDMVVFENINPDRVYLMGYSAGGDGVYQLAPRMAFRFAAASMMAGHPNETVPDGLRNLPFCIHMGARDSAYNRNRIAGEWKQKLAALHAADTEGYIHEVELHEGRGHWMNLEDAVAVPWMAKYSRQRYPTKVIWKQDNVIHSRFYWLRMSPQNAAGRPRVVASVSDNTIKVESGEVSELTILLHDDLVDLDRSVTIHANGAVVVEHTPQRTIGTISRTLLEGGDPTMAVFDSVSVSVPR